MNFKSIESLRGYMAWWVVVAHALNILGSPSGRLFNLAGKAETAVNIFIIISGFVITHMMISKPSPYRVYLARRFFRLYPIYMVALVAAIALTGLYTATFIDLPWAVGAQARVERLASQATYLPWHLGLHLTLLHGIVSNHMLPFSETAFLSPGWSLSLEWQFYLIAPFLIAGARRGGILLLLIVIAMVALTTMSAHYFEGSFDFKSFLPLALTYFAIGIASRVAISKPSIYSIAAVLLPLLFAGRTEAVIWVVFFGFALSENEVWRLPEAAKRIIEPFVFGRWIGNVGKWSYSTYLLHIPVFTLVVGTYVQIVGPENASYPVVASLLVLSMPTILLLSALSFRFVERPANGFGHRITLASSASQ